jgi:hypothetical protein
MIFSQLKNTVLFYCLSKNGKKRLKFYSVAFNMINLSFKFIQLFLKNSEDWNEIQHLIGALKVILRDTRGAIRRPLQK